MIYGPMSCRIFVRVGSEERFLLMHSGAFWGPRSLKEVDIEYLGYYP